ncbi:Hypothetical protein GSB_154686 [Giardia duodenalis]|uniref:Major capsid protein n=1 Tax=Giardia intestinalis TaxID=5741 RepID=V6TQH4_GIAIN|nr:Hypothetical protein GSB_154686 [Giardia intestinalis]
MSRYILKAECATAEPLVNLLQSQTPGLALSDPKNLVVFVGDKAKNNPGVSIMPCSGGLYAPQQFVWKDPTLISSLDTTKLFLDVNNITVTLAVDLQVSADSNLTYGNPGTTIPTGALAVNLGSKGFQFNSSNMINGDEWGKLVYYEPGGLGVGWAFNANTYLPRQGYSVPSGLGMYMLGGLLPDVSYNSLVSQTGVNNAQLLPSYNLQVGRDQALLTQMVSVGNFQGPQGYWSVQPTNLDTTAATSGRAGGSIVGSTETMSPTFSAYNPFGFLCLSFPTALQSTSQSAQTQGWNLQFPSYGPSTQDGYMMTGNCLSVSPGTFFTDQGLALLQSPDSAPSSSPAITPFMWNEYWTNATSNIHLEETKPFYIEAPLFNAPVALNLIPNYQDGLSMLVPITRICNGVYLYTPIKNGTGDVQAVNMNTKQVSDDPNYFVNPFGTLQKWFVPKRVSLTINMPFVRVDSAIQASRFFGTPYLDQNFSITVPLWIKFHFMPQEGPEGPVDPQSVDKTASLTQIAAASPNGVMEMVFTAREILNRFGTVLASHNQPISKGQWGLQSLEISRVMVSCTTALDFPRLYRYLLSLGAFLTSPQGAIIRAGGTKVFSRCGASLSAGPPSDMTLVFDDVLGDTVGYVDGTGVRTARFDINNVVSSSYGMTNDDYFNSTAEFVFSRSVFLRVPEESSLTDDGGQVTVSFRPRPVLNMPFSGEVLKTPAKGGPQFTNSGITNGNVTSQNLASYSQGWFNNLNPYSQDYNSSYATANASSNLDTYPFMDYKMVDFNRRKIEIWFQLQVPVQIYTGSPFS